MPLIARIAMIVASMAVLASYAGLVRDDAGCAHFADGARFSVRGTLETRPDDAVRTVQLQTDASGACRTLRVRLPDDAAGFKVGDAIEATGTWMVQRVSAENDGLLIATAVQRVPPRGQPLLVMRGHIQERLRALFPRTYPLAEALLIAQREGINPEVKQDFAASGLTHLLAISGTHVALVAAVLLLIARLLRVSNTIASVTAILGSTLYVLFLGAPAAALRALIQMVLLFASRARQRPAHPLGLLATAAIIITALDPRAPLDAGFQLSFAGICGIVLWRRRIAQRLPPELPNALRDAVATTLAATMTTTPIAAYQFGIVSTIAVLSNLLAGPVVSLAVPMAGAALALSYISMSAAHFVAGGAELTLLWLGHIANLCGNAPFGHFFVTPHTAVVATLCGALALHAARRTRHSTAAGRVLLACMGAAVPVSLLPLLPHAHAHLEIHMVDVGQGDGFAIRTPHGHWLLVDAGPWSEKFDAGKARMVPFLLQHDAGHIDLAVLSHPHLDHFGGLRSIAARIPIDAIVDPAMPVSNPPFDSLLLSVQAKHTRWLLARPGSSVVVDGVRMEFLAPDSVSLDPKADPNDFSAAFRLTYGSFHALFLGDMYMAEERQLVQRYGSLVDVDLLKVAHHGSASSSSEELLRAASPKLALISVGRRNHYGHPDIHTIEKLGAAGATVFRTDRDGTVSVFVSAAGRITVATAQ